MDRVQALHHYLESTRLAFADRNRYVGDPAFVNVPQRPAPVRRLRPAAGLPDRPDAGADQPGRARRPERRRPACSAPATATRRRADDGHAHQPLRGQRPVGQRRRRTRTRSSRLGGNGIVVPGRGFLLNNELTDFNFTPTQGTAPDPNLPAAGKRPRSRACRRRSCCGDGKPFLAVGSPGGATIITTVLQILVNRIDFGMTLPDAIAAPRASQRNSATTQAEPDFIALPTTPGLEALGQQFAISDTSPLDPSIQIPPTIGAATGLEFLGHGQVLAAGEPTRRGGSSAAVVSLHSENEAVTPR